MGRKCPFKLLPQALTIFASYTTWLFIIYVYTLFEISLKILFKTAAYCKFWYAYLFPNNELEDAFKNGLQQQKKVK